MMAAVSALMILVATVAMIILDRLFGLDRILVGKG
jgi:putative spermidine/putrescine transport system permease protein